MIIVIRGGSAYGREAGSEMRNSVTSICTRAAKRQMFKSQCRSLRIVHRNVFAISTLSLLLWLGFLDSFEEVVEIGLAKCAVFQQTCFESIETVLDGG